MFVKVYKGVREGVVEGLCKVLQFQASRAVGFPGSTPSKVMYPCALRRLRV